MMKKIYWPDFLQIYKSGFNRPYVSFIIQKTDVCVGNLSVVIFGDQKIKDFKDEGKWNTDIKDFVRPL